MSTKKSAGKLSKNPEAVSCAARVLLTAAGAIVVQKVCEFPVTKSDLQKQLEAQGHVFAGQEPLIAHETDETKPCLCGRAIK